MSHKTGNGSMAVMQQKRNLHRKRVFTGALDSIGASTSSTHLHRWRKCTNNTGYTAKVIMGNSFLLLLFFSTLRGAFGWSNGSPRSNIHLFLATERGHSITRDAVCQKRAINYLAMVRTLASKQSFFQLYATKPPNHQSSPQVTSSSDESTTTHPVMEELNAQLNSLTQFFNQDYSDNENEDDLQLPIRIMYNMLASYSKLNQEYTDSKSKNKNTPGKSSLVGTASATIEKAFRLITNEAFSTPYQIHRVNMGMEAIQLQLHTKKISVSESIHFVALPPPYNSIPRGTWLRALRALTSREIGNISVAFNSRSIRCLVPSERTVWITPSDAAFRILQRLVTGVGVRTNNKSKNNTNRNNSRSRNTSGNTKQQLQYLDERDFNMVLHSYASLTQNQMHAAHRVMALQERTPHAPPLSPVAYSILLKAYGRWRDTKNVEMSVIHAQRNGVAPDIVMMNSLLDAYINCGLLDRARDLFRSMRPKGVKTRVDLSGSVAQTVKTEDLWSLLRPNTRTYNTLLKGMAEVGDIDGALDLAKEMKQTGLWDEITTNTLVKAAVTALEFEIAEDILTNHTVTINGERGVGANSQNSRVRKSRDHPNVEAYTELLDGYAKSSQLEKAVGVMQLMQKRGVEPNEYTYTCMVGAFARNNKTRQARKMIGYATEMILSSSSSQRRRNTLTPTFNAFISGILTENSSSDTESKGQSSHAANVLEALEIVQEMQDLNISPNVVTVTLLIDGLGRCNPPRCQEAKDLVQHLEFTTRPPRASYYADILTDSNEHRVSLSNIKIATAMIRAYGRANDIESAIQSFERIPNPDVVALNAILDACCRSSQLKLALEKFGEYVSFEQWRNQINDMAAVAKSGTTIKPDVVTYTTLISALLQLRSKAATKRAVRLYDEMKKKWWIYPDTVLVDTILTTMLSGGSFGFEPDDIQFTLTVLQDASGLEWEDGQYEKRKKAVRSILVGCSSEVWKNDEFAYGLQSTDKKKEADEDPLFVKKGWNRIDSGFRLWGGGNTEESLDWTRSPIDGVEDGKSDLSAADSFLASKGWNDIDSGFRIL
mmetsp:Transcript_13049/g.26078  ORF Transcript_13049/g.26078 Transcript_13049/m.26078 type:complete len:1055 (+) Transcript_13049:229-3393(+)